MNPGSRSRLGSPHPNLAALKLLTDDQLMAQLQAGVNDALAVLFVCRGRVHGLRTAHRNAQRGARFVESALPESST